MRKTNDMLKRFLAIFLAMVLAYGNVPIQVAYGVEAAKAEEMTASSDAPAAQTEEGVDSAAEGDGQTEEGADAAAELSGDSDDGNAGVPEPTVAATTQSSEESPYQIAVAFDGLTLSEGQNNIDGTWSSNAITKVASIKLKKKDSLWSPEAGKSYVLSMKVPEALFFSGEPDHKTTGLSEVVTKQNPTPQVYTVGSKAAKTNLPGFSMYSGEIRMRIDTTVDDVEIPGISINVNENVVGYSSEPFVISNAFDVKLLEMNDSETLDGYEDENVTCLAERTANNLNVKLAGSASAMRMAISTDGFGSTNYEKNQSISRSGTIGFTAATSGSTWQVYKKLVVEFKCPYIEVDGIKHYLSFEQNDTSLTSNRHGSTAGFAPSSPAVYNASDHTITYTFENIYTGGHNAFLVSPVFSWPNGLSEEDAPDSSYEIKGVGWTIKESACYPGTKSLVTQVGATYTASEIGSFVADGANVKLVSSAQAPTSEKIAKRSIYKGMTIGSGATGALGFFDIHNTGAGNSTSVNVKFNFNTSASSDGAYCYVTRVNMPVSGNSGGTKVRFVLEDEKGSTKEGEASFSNTTSFSCTPASLCKAAGMGDGAGYYIKSLSYTSATLAKNHAYHAETAHLYRNRDGDSGLFFGYVKGEAGAKFHASMSISATDSTTPITTDGKTKLEATEESTLSDMDFIGMSLNTPTFDGSASKSITAGNTAKLSFTAIPSTEEYYSPTSKNTVNGYHILRDPVVYVCLPDGVSISGTSDVSAWAGSREVKATDVAPLGDTFSTGDTVARWWQINLGGANVPGGTGLGVTLSLSTDRMMAGCSWDFRQAVVVRAKGQELSWNAASQTSTVYNSANSLKNSGRAALVQLGNLLATDADANGSLGTLVESGATACMLSVVRAEAKLDVSTTLAQEDQTAEPGSSIKVTDENAKLDYDVNVSSSEGGTASKFSYYIPIVKADAPLNPSAFVTGSDYSLKLNDEVKITGSNEDGAPLTGMPFDVFYTTVPRLTFSSIQALGDGYWKRAADLNDDFSRVTAMKIITKDNEDGGPSTIWPGSTFKFELKLSYDNAASDFAANAGRTVSWRTFGHYTYTRNGAQTTNTYPSGTNSIKLGYVSDRRKATPINVTLDTSGNAQGTATLELNQAFNTNKTLKIKKVVSSNLSLTAESPRGYSGEKANTTFRIGLGLNGLAKRYLSAGPGGTYAIAAGQKVSVDVAVDFSTALTDVGSERYVDVTIGDDDVDITVRVILVRQVKPADVTGAGVAVGENYATTTVSDSVTIASNSAFSALFPVDGFVPANHPKQLLKWKTSGGEAENIPAGTTIVMVGLNSENKAESYWLYQGTESQVDLASFVNMDTGKPFEYDTKSVAATSLKYLFVVNFANAQASTGSYKVAFGADTVSGAAAFTDVDKDVELVSPGSYSLKSNGSGLSYTVIASSGNESFLANRSLALVLKPSVDTSLPADAKLVSGENEYARNTKGEYVVPLGTIASGSKDFAIKSSMLPSGNASYSIDAQLVLVGSTEDSSPDAGRPVAAAKLELSTASSPLPSLSVTGTRNATVADWNSGQSFGLSVNGMEDCSLTVTAYRGLKGSDKVTNLLSNVYGRFTIENGAGTYNPAGTPTGKLQLSPVVQPGTYRLVFEVKKDGKTLLTVPYAIIVRP